MKTPRLVKLAPALATLAAGLILGHVASDVPATVASAGIDVDRYVPGETRLHAMLTDGTCWRNDGKTHPTPTRVWMNEPWSMAGDTKYVLHGADHTAAVLGDPDRWADVAAFCE